MSDITLYLRTVKNTNQLDELDSHPVITAINQELKQARRKRQEVVWPSPPELAYNVDDGGRDTRVFLWVHEPLLDLGPCRA